MESCCIAIDLKSFYASVECVERGLDPLTTNLVVADPSRTEKTICLAVSPSLKACGIPGRPRLFEAVRRMREVNALRRRRAPGGSFRAPAYDAEILAGDPGLEAAFITAPPRMALYIDYSRRIYGIYLRHAAPEDIHVYSIDEVFINAAPYLGRSGLTPRGYALEVIRDILAETGITSTAGIGTNLYLAKVAMDIVAKKMPPDADGVRIAELDESAYRHTLWEHTPLTDFWRVGNGTARRLARYGITTMGDIARTSVHAEGILYRLFGVNAELLIDHAWGWEPCTIRDIKAYRPSSTSIGSGQVLQCAYDFEKARIVAREMAEQLACDLVRRNMAARSVVLTAGYEAIAAGEREYGGELSTDRYGRNIPRHAHGTAPLAEPTSSARAVIAAVLGLFDSVVDRELQVRRLSITAAGVCPLTDIRPKNVRLSLLDPPAEEQKQEKESRERELRMQKAVIGIRDRWGKNSLLMGTDLREGATGRERNLQIGGHKA